MAYPERVRIYEVGPRDGLQNEKQLIPTAIKLELIKRLKEAGLTMIEATSFVSPKWVPQMADHTEIMQALSAQSDQDVTYPVLTPNIKGYDAALAAGAKECAVFAAASESFSQKNINCSIDESIQRFSDVMVKANAHNIPIRGYISCITACPYEGRIEPQAVLDVAHKLLDMGCYEISLADTIGQAPPKDITTLLDLLLQEIPAIKLALHCHDTYGQALANIHTGVQMGITTIDSSIAGLGGCPYAQGASGNVATEDVVYMLHGCGVNTGLDLTRLIESAWYISSALNRQPSSKVSLALKPS